MITIVNYLTGTLICLIAKVLLKINSSLQGQYSSVKNKIMRIAVEETNISNYIHLALIMIEDKRFYNHPGIDFYSVLRAIKNTVCTRLEGASTIAQQLIRGITKEREITINRKIKEIMLAVLISKEFTKDQILSAYLHSYDFIKCIGVIEFCKYENYNIRHLSISESAQIAARFKYPQINKNNYIKYLKRVRTIEYKISRRHKTWESFFLKYFNNLNQKIVPEMIIPEHKQIIQ